MNPNHDQTNLFNSNLPSKSIFAFNHIHQNHNLVARTDTSQHQTNTIHPQIFPNQNHQYFLTNNQNINTQPIFNIQNSQTIANNQNHPNSYYYYNNQYNPNNSFHNNNPFINNQTYINPNSSPFTNSFLSTCNSQDILNNNRKIDPYKYLCQTLSFQDIIPIMIHKLFDPEPLKIEKLTNYNYQKNFQSLEKLFNIQQSIQKPKTSQLNYQNKKNRDQYQQKILSNYHTSPNQFQINNPNYKEQRWKRYQKHIQTQKQRQVTKKRIQSECLDFDNQWQFLKRRIIDKNNSLNDSIQSNNNNPNVIKIICVGEQKNTKSNHKNHNNLGTIKKNNQSFRNFTQSSQFLLTPKFSKTEKQTQQKQKDYDDIYYNRIQHKYKIPIKNLNPLADPQDLPLCTKFTLQPSLANLARLSKQELKNVQNLKVSNQHGIIQFLHGVNLLRVNFDEMIIIKRNNIYIDEFYKDIKIEKNGLILTFFRFGDLKQRLEGYKQLVRQNKLIENNEDKIIKKLKRYCFKKMMNWIKQHEMTLIEFDDEQQRLKIQI